MNDVTTEDSVPQVDRDYAYACKRVDEAIAEIRQNPNRAHWTDAELADGLAVSYAGYPPIASAAPGLFATAVILLANAEDEIRRLREAIDVRYAQDAAHAAITAQSEDGAS